MLQGDAVSRLYLGHVTRVYLVIKGPVWWAPTVRWRNDLRARRRKALSPLREGQLSVRGRNNTRAHT